MCRACGKMASYVNGRLRGFPYQCVREGNEVKLRVWIDGLICAADINYAMMANGVGKTGITPLMLVAMRGHAGCVDLLLQRGADLNFQYKHGLSALMYAAKANHPAVVQRLLKAGADMAARSANGQTALQIAKEKHSRECVEVFLSHLNGRTPKASNFSKGDLLQIHCVDEEEAEREEVGEVRNLVGTICMVTMVAEWGLWLITPDRRMPVAVVSYRMLQQYSRNDEIPWSWQLWATAGLMWRGLRASHRMHHLQQAEGHRLASLSADAKVNYCLAPRCRPSISFCICLCAGGRLSGLHPQTPQWGWSPRRDLWRQLHRHQRKVQRASRSLRQRHSWSQPTPFTQPHWGRGRSPQRALCGQLHR